MSDLDERLLAAHARGDIKTLIALYQEASHAANDATARSFYLTHAYVYALEVGDSCAADIYMRLVGLGAEPAPDRTAMTTDVTKRQNGHNKLGRRV